MTGGTGAVKIYMIPKKDYIIPREREMDFTPEVWNSLSETAVETKKWHGVKIECIYNFFINRKCFCIYKKANVDKAGDFIVKKYINNPAYFKKIWSLHKKFGAEAEKTTANIFKTYFQYSPKQEIQALQSLKHHWIRFDQVNVLPWYTGAEKLRENIAQQLNSKYPISEKEILELWAANSLSLPSLEEVKLLSACIAYQKGGDLKKLSKKLSTEFGWIPFGYDGPLFWDKEYYEKEIIASSKKSWRLLKKQIDKINGQVLQIKINQKKIINKYKFDSQLIRLLDIQQKLYTMTDERKKIQFKIHHVYHLILERLEKQHSLTLQELKYLETGEVAKMVKTQAFATYKKIAIGRIKNSIFSITENGKIIHFEATPKTGKKLFNFVLNTENVREFSGQIANTAGKKIIVGKARVISNSRQIYTMKKGEILVTAMTTPDFVQAMKVAKGIITDEGGITSHAAIVSREMGIPCIIGTKIATQILKNGDLVELNTSTGIIKKITK